MLLRVVACHGESDKNAKNFFAAYAKKEQSIFKRFLALGSLWKLMLNCSDTDTRKTFNK